MKTIILGPPGTGKTTTLLNLVEDFLRAGTDIKKIGYFSFTKKAAWEATRRAEEKFMIDAKDIPNFRKTSIKGHKGEFVLGNLNNEDIICANGRFHYYEGYAYEKVAIIIDVFKKFLKDISKLSLLDEIDVNFLFLICK